MRNPINDERDIQQSGEATNRKPWQSPSLLRLDAEHAELNPAPGVDANTSAS
ncbi:hypothetical protein [Brevundimonas sp.]|uniref:hypothetical protein n=1 Tax=Brevundimonas sp. TaxID=1871086 RepID=UPI001D5EA3E1|nr:hypothetical protein [Brevundimonas sp.]MBL0947335.1 hypothetical protein [Brevundimonas sp.]